ncbi:MAG: 2-oxoacid:acceptor oxidoreductase subunit alpha [Chloroflexi bacterium]|nr:2-oxoacid:acceptor oxidoreductase subunit alpha [Chloroflexota bacterium]
MGVRELVAENGGARPSIINDFSIVVATANGTGSQTANLALLRALFKMGIPVNGKNIFPSNIQGLPTWYHIRVSKDGYVAWRHTSEILVAFNEATVLEDVQNLPSGGLCLYNADWRKLPRRDDVTMVGIPVNQFVRETGLKGKLRNYIANMVFLGALAQLLAIPLDKIEEALGFYFKGRKKLVDSNMAVAAAAAEWTAVNIPKTDPYGVVEMEATRGQIMMTGNEAAGLGTVFGGVTYAAWYPITPSTGIIDSLNYYLGRLRKEPETGKATYVVTQAEDELAAIGMVLGAGWAGARAMTATSGPGISLMAEFAGLGYFAEIPGVIWDVQRVGPSTGLPTRSGQGDVTFVYYLGHGDTKNVILFPSTIKECFEFGAIAHNLADQLQTLIFVLSDLDLGMNKWLSDPFEYPEESINRGKVLQGDEIPPDWGRYRDVDGDGISYRTLPGDENWRGAWFARGTGHNENAVYSERPSDWLDNMARLQRKFETARMLVPGPVVDRMAGASIGIIAFGTTRYAIEEARDRLTAAGLKTDFMRLRALPISAEVKTFVANHDQIYVIELNRDGQLHAILQTEMPAMATKLISLAYLDGMPLTAHWVVGRLTDDGTRNTNNGEPKWIADEQ